MAGKGRSGQGGVCRSGGTRSRAAELFSTKKTCPQERLRVLSYRATLDGLCRRCSGSRWSRHGAGHWARWARAGTRGRGPSGTSWSGCLSCQELITWGRVRCVSPARTPVEQPAGEQPRRLGNDVQSLEPLPSRSSLNDTASTIATTLISGYDSRHSERRGMSGYRIHRQVTEFGGHVRGWRMVLGLTAQQVSERAGITRDTLRKIESGNPNVSFNSVTQVLRALGILDQLVAAADPLASDIGRLRAGRLTRKRAR